MLFNYAQADQIPPEEKMCQGDAVAVLLDGGVWWPACSLTEKKVKFWSDGKVKSGQKISKLNPGL